MEEHTLIGVLIAIVSALGIKEVWQIWKRKIDGKQKLDEISLHNDHEALKLIISDQRRMIDNLTEKIEEMEAKIDQLIEENKECAVKLARMEERLTANLASSGRRSTTKKTK